MNGLRKIISEELNLIWSYLNESFNSKIKTEFEIHHKIIDNDKHTSYRFHSDSNTYYDLNFFEEIIIPSELQLNNGQKLVDYLSNNFEKINASHISFTLTERTINNDDISSDDYSENTNKNEPIELMGRIAFLVDSFMKINPEQLIFIIGKNTNHIKLKIYLQMFENLFSLNFKKFEGNSDFYDYEDAYYFVNNKILK
jgi:hypothetical protein